MKIQSFLIGVVISLTLSSAVFAKVDGEMKTVIIGPPKPPRPPVDCAYIKDPILDPLQYISLMQTPDPIYIGGERYILNKENFTPIFTTVVYTCPGLEPLVVRKYTGFEISLPVYNDFGQPIFFDIAGRTDRHMNLTVSCGTFSASDSGDKFYISQSVVTNGSCNTLSMKFDFTATAIQPRALDLSLSISEEL
ncbi:hypothetical protein [Pseudoalteromonas sp. S558]|uniref:hypothetical protein n=1 Tax=Pseudoalteromonas sp. S558 TaxID=2066515 RepID=UPI00110B7B89|nr:hypothetical protein [Pseudoalteromonas sp. S558]TMN94155.1 hypothetical protein CWB66_20550 [Pseudoalteromonas sp. S558]